MSSDEETQDEGIGVSGRLLGFLLLGITLVFAGIAVLVVASLVFGGSSVGGVILVGPIPIVFGAGPDAAWLIAVSIIFTVVTVVLLLIMNRRTRRA